MHNIAIIHGYGRVVDNNPFYELYISKLSYFLEKENLDTIICSGGFTDPNIHQSEAQSMKSKLAQKLNFQGEWFLEEKSFTTYENIIECEKFLPKNQDKQITVFSRNTHLPKIIYQSLQSYLKLEKKEVLSLI